MLQGTTEQNIWKIAQTGFATVAKHDGRYGRGIYFSSNVDYAKHYSKLATKQETPLFLILAFVIPGNIFPVVENPEDVNGFLGKPVVGTGYQSHYVNLWPPVHQKMGYVTPTCDNINQCVDELVVFQDAQTLPKYVLVVE